MSKIGDHPQQGINQEYYNNQLPAIDKRKLSNNSPMQLISVIREDLPELEEELQDSIQLINLSANYTPNNLL